MEEIDEFNIEETPQQEDGSYFDEWLINQLGSDKILTGSPESMIEVDVKDLPLKSKVAILEDLIQESTGQLLNKVQESELSDDERAVIEMLRNNQLHELYNAIKEELELTDLPDKLSGDEAVYWSLKSTYNDLDDEDIESQLQALKESPNYDKVVQSAEEKYKQFLQDYKQQQYTNQVLRNQELREETKQKYASIISNLDDDLLDYDEEDKNEVFSALFDVDDSGSNDFYDLFKSPEGMVEIAKRVLAYDRLKDMVTNLTVAIEQLNNKSINSIGSNNNRVRSNDLSQYFTDI